MYKVPVRDKEFGVGKRMGDNLYFHISYAEEIIGKRKFNKAKKIAEKTWIEKWGQCYDILSGIQVIKYNKKKNTISFMFCEEFYDSLEPGVVGYIFVNLNTESGKIVNYNKDFPIYHHKQLMVREDFDLFIDYPMEVLKVRSENISKMMNSDLFNIEVCKIGSYLYWEDRARPILCRMKGWQELVLNN